MGFYRNPNNIYYKGGKFQMSSRIEVVGADFPTSPPPPPQSSFYSAWHVAYDIKVCEDVNVLTTVVVAYAGCSLKVSLRGTSWVSHVSGRQADREGLRSCRGICAQTSDID